MQCPRCGSEIFPQQELCFRCGERFAASSQADKWLVPLGTLLSYPVAIHKSGILLALGAVLLELYLSELDWQLLVRFPLWLVIWASVVLAHELGHVVSMRMQRLSCRQVVLYPLPIYSIRRWGVSGNARQKTAAALAGPMTSLAISLLLLPLVTLWPAETWPVALCALHAMAGAVNLLPIEPLDGAMIFRHPDLPATRPEPVPLHEVDPLDESLHADAALDFELETLETPNVPDVDEILDKILATGMDSLTEQERTILHEASRHLRR